MAREQAFGDSNLQVLARAYADKHTESADLALERRVRFNTLATDAETVKLIPFSQPECSIQMTGWSPIDGQLAWSAVLTRMHVPIERCRDRSRMAHQVIQT